MADADLSPEIRLLRLALSGAENIADHAPDLAPLAERHAPALERIQTLIQPGELFTHDLPGAIAAHFDRLASVDPDLAAAAYTFGDRALTAAFAAEAVAVAEHWADLDGDILDFGCGAGRITAALGKRTPQPRSITGLDISKGMLAAARARVPGARFVLGDGATLPFDDAAFDLVLAVDSFPFLVQAGVLAGQLAEIARVLRPGGRLLVFHLSYGDPAGAQRIVDASPLKIVRGPERPFRRWDAPAWGFAHR